MKQKLNVLGLLAGFLFFVLFFNFFSFCNSSIEVENSQVSLLFQGKAYFTFSILATLAVQSSAFIITGGATGVGVGMLSAVYAIHAFFLVSASKSGSIPLNTPEDIINFYLVIDIPQRWQEEAFLLKYSNFSSITLSA